ncbi:zinc finger domain-containing protein [Mycolicibacterium monacense]|uniref:DNA-binding phage zinc finger domain-containing protein n=1 Tax=Mycolicibacterium monacense TaxID=85693 RepID=A0AAD1MZ24_MYCMB|nr:hypothetical protein MMON_14460 [Mycolicibacterium monacense]
MPNGNPSPDTQPTLTHPCPFCEARPGQPCRDMIGDQARVVGPHLTRIAAAVDPQTVRRGGAR